MLSELGLEPGPSTPSSEVAIHQTVFPRERPWSGGQDPKFATNLFLVLGS